MYVQASPYGILSSDFWDGTTGPEIAEAGGMAAQLVACYLMSNKAATMIGLYPLDVLVMRVQIRTVSPKQIVTALAVLKDVGWAFYDAATKMVWVREMAKFRLGLHLKPLDAKDNRLKHVHRLYASAKPNPFLAPFYDRYRIDLHLPLQRVFGGASQDLLEGLSRGSITRGFEGASKTVTVTGSVTGSEDQQEQEDQDQRLRRRVPLDPDDSWPVLQRLAHAVLDDAAAGQLAEADIPEELKCRAARAKLVYDGDRVRKALDACRMQRRISAGGGRR